MEGMPWWCERCSNWRVHVRVLLSLFPDALMLPAGLQAIAEVAASIRAGYYTIGIAGGVSLSGWLLWREARH